MCLKSPHVPAQLLAMEDLHVVENGQVEMKMYGGKVSPCCTVQHIKPNIQGRQFDQITHSTYDTRQVLTLKQNTL